MINDNVDVKQSVWEDGECQQSRANNLYGWKWQRLKYSTRGNTVVMNERAVWQRLGTENDNSALIMQQFG